MVCHIIDRPIICVEIMFIVSKLYFNPTGIFRYADQHNKNDIRHQHSRIIYSMWAIRLWFYCKLLILLTYYLAFFNLLGAVQRIRNPDMKRQFNTSAGIDRALIRSRGHKQKYKNRYL